MDVRKLYDDKPNIAAFDLDGKDITVTIERVEGGLLVSDGGRKAKKPILYFKGKAKGFVCNITNAKTIHRMYGSFESSDWIGKRITLYPTTTDKGGEIVDCIRIRPIIPKGKGEAIRADVAPPAETAMVTAT